MKTIYTVIEDQGPVEVCVNLTKPQIDTEDEMVFVESLDFPSSVHIPAGAAHTSGKCSYHYKLQLEQAYSTHSSNVTCRPHPQYCIFGEQSMWM